MRIQRAGVNSVCLTKGRTMWKNRLFGGAVFATVLVATALLAAKRDGEAEQAGRPTVKLGLHHQVPGGLLLHPRERRQEVGRGAPRARR